MVEIETDIEKNLIGSLILKPDSLREVNEIVSNKDFKIDLYRHAFVTMNSMMAKGDEIEITNLYLEMGRPGNASTIVESFDDCIFSPPYYARILKKRNLENEINAAAKEREYDDIQKKVLELRGLGKPVELEIITDIIAKGENKQEVILTGYKDLDSIVQLERSDLMVLAGRPGVGKSLLACTILANMAAEHAVGIISFEMSAIKIVKRLTSAHSLNYLNCINQNLMIASPSIFNLKEVRKILDEIVLKKNAKAVMIDYLQLMSETREFRSRHLEVSYIIRSLKEMAREFQVAMIVVSALSRGEKSDTIKPVLSSLKESGDIEYTCDSVCFLHREKNELNADLIVSKNRNGRLGIVKLIWLPQKIAYGSWEWKEENQG